MGATWEALANYLKIGAQKIEASFDELASDDLNSSGQKLKKKKKAKGKQIGKGVPDIDLDLDMDQDDISPQTRFKK